MITLPDAIKWDAWRAGTVPPHSSEMATLYGGLDQPGPYLVLMKWYPGYMSAPHSYATESGALRTRRCEQAWMAPRVSLGSSAAELGDRVRPTAHGLLHRGRSLISESFHASHIIASFA